MALLIPVGVALTLLGLAGVIWCILKVTHARKAQVDDDAMRAVMQSIVAVNMAALALSGIGLAMVVMGIVLG